MLTKTNSKLSKQISNQDSRISEIQKELQSKTQRLEMFRNYKTSIENKGKALSSKVSPFPNTI